MRKQDKMLANRKKGVITTLKKRKKSIVISFFSFLKHLTIVLLLLIVLKGFIFPPYVNHVKIIKEVSSTSLNRQFSIGSEKKNLSEILNKIKSEIGKMGDYEGKKEINEAFESFQRFKNANDSKKKIDQAGEALSNVIDASLERNNLSIYSLYPIKSWKEQARLDPLHFFILNNLFSFFHATNVVTNTTAKNVLEIIFVVFTMKTFLFVLFAWENVKGKKLFWKYPWEWLKLEFQESNDEEELARKDLIKKEFPILLLKVLISFTLPYFILMSIGNHPSFLKNYSKFSWLSSHVSWWIFFYYFLLTILCSSANKLLLLTYKPTKKNETKELFKDCVKSITLEIFISLLFFGLYNLIQICFFQSQELVSWTWMTYFSSWLVSDYFFDDIIKFFLDNKITKEEIKK